MKKRKQFITTGILNCLFMTENVNVHAQISVENSLNVKSNCCAD